MEKGTPTQIFFSTISKIFESNFLIEAFGAIMSKYSSKVVCVDIIQKHLTGRLKACNFIKKETLTQVFSCEFCEIFKNNFFYRAPLVAASDYNKKTSK